MLDLILCLVAWIVIFILMTGTLYLISKIINLNTGKKHMPFRVCCGASAILSIIVAVNIWAIILT